MMSAFNFDLQDNNGKCVSKNGTTCSYYHGSFDFDEYKTAVGNSYENNDGGLGGFVGPNHEYFLYCGSKYPEIAVVKFNQSINKWEGHGCLQWQDLEDDEDGYFKNIWFTETELALIFEPKNKYRVDLMEHTDLARGKACIQLDLSTGTFTGVTREQLTKQGHSIVDRDSEWPPLSSKSRPSKDCSLESTLFEVPRPILTQKRSLLKILDNMKAEICACLDEASHKLTHPE